MLNGKSALVVALVVSSAAAALAQPAGKAPDAAAGATAVASGPAASPPRPGAGPRARWGSEFTPGWSLMTPQERSEHRARLRSITSYDECVAYIEQHREQMKARAQERGRRGLGTPKGDPCAPLKP